MEREQAAEEFARMLHRVGIDETYKMFFEMMNDPLGAEKAKWQDISRWYASKSSEEQQFINMVLKEALVSSVFRLAVNFDGAAGFEEVDGKIAEYAIKLNVYDTEEEEEQGRPTQSVEIVPTKGSGDIHDIFLNIVDEQTP